MDGKLVSVNNLEFHYEVGDFNFSLNSFDVSKNEKIAIVGPSGIGKTTLLNLISGILIPDSGDIIVDEENISQLSYDDRQDFRALKMGLVFQEFELLEYLTVLDNIILPFRISTVLEYVSTVEERAKKLCADVGLENKMNRYPGNLSQGERQRIAVCRALITEPILLLCDEPTGNLDNVNRNHVIEKIFSYSDSTGAPIVVITHDTEILDRFTRIIDITELTKSRQDNNAKMENVL